MLVLEVEQGSPPPGAIERTLVHHASRGSAAADPAVTAYVLAAGRPRVSAPEQRVRLSQAAAEPAQERDSRGGVWQRRGCW
jgi:hypothetical protein